MGFQHTTWLEKVANPVDREAEERGQRNVIVHWLSFDSSAPIALPSRVSLRWSHWRRSAL